MLLDVKLYNLAFSARGLEQFVLHGEKEKEKGKGNLRSSVMFNYQNPETMQFIVLPCCRMAVIRE